MSSNSSFFGDLLTTIADRGRALLDRSGRTTGATRAATLVDRCEELLTGRGEAVPELADHGRDPQQLAQGGLLDIAQAQG